MSRFLDRLAARLSRLARWMNLAAGWLFVVCAVFITAEVLARNFLGFSTQSTTELSGYMLAVGISWGLANALAERAHVRIDIFINKLPAGVRQPLHAVALVFLLVLAVAMAYGAWYITNESIEFRAADMTGLRTPLAIPQGLWGFGILVFACLCLVLVARAVLLLARGQGAEVDRLLGSRTYQDEAREVLDAVGKGEPGGREHVIAVVFLVLLVAVMLVAAMFGQSTGPLPIAELLVLIALFCLFFGAGVYIAAVLGVLGLIFGFAFSDRPFWLYIGQMLWNPSSNFLLVAIPLFLLMGEIMLRAGLSEKLYRALNRFLHRMPGGLLHTNIVSCGVFSAVSGSSVATAATMGSVALPYFANTNYSPRWVLGSLAAGGALGNLIPPGITFILYGLLTDTSVGKLYFAALGPSALVLALFTVVIFWHGLGKGRRERAHGPAAEGIGRALWDLVPTTLLIGMVLGTIYAGVATPTESAAFGVVGAMIFAAIDRRLSWRLLHQAAEATARTTAMIGLILLGAYLLNHILTSIQVPQKLANVVGGLPLPPWAIMLIIVGFYLALGTFMEGFSMIITTIPVIFPVVKALGYDPIWFGVIITMLVEIALISPPDGTVLYVLQGMRPDRGSITDVFWGVLPFLGVYILAILVLMFLPEIALWLPRVAM